MIPVKLLDAQPHHLVLDSCASPGSKTSQILEVMLDKHASGAVVANDASLQRANLLTHRCYRLEAVAKNLLVINHDAQTLPLELENTFDRILCDVPCSGDGTLRKSTDLWKKWSNSSGVELHSIQVNVVTRALRLLKHDGGGRLVYSTCSLNPLENEAVVVELLKRSQGAIRLVDCSKMLPGLKRLPGLTEWSVQDLKTGKWYDTYDSYAKDNQTRSTKIKKSILKKVYDKGLAAWATGHRVGVAPHQWATGRVYSFVTLGKTVKKGNKKMPDYSLAVEAGLVKEKKKKNPSEWRHGEFAEDDPFEEYFEA